MNKVQVKETPPQAYIQDLCSGDCFKTDFKDTNTQVFMKVHPCPYENKSYHYGEYNCVNLSDGTLWVVVGVVFPVTHVTIEKK